MIMCRRPAIVPMAVTTPAAGAPPHSPYISHAAHRPSSSTCEPGSISRAIRSRAVSRPFGVLPLDRRRAAAQRDLDFLRAELSGQDGERRRLFGHAIHVDVQLAGAVRWAVRETVSFSNWTCFRLTRIEKAESRGQIEGVASFGSST